METDSRSTGSGAETEGYTVHDGKAGQPEVDRVSWEGNEENEESPKEGSDAVEYDGHEDEEGIGQEEEEEEYKNNPLWVKRYPGDQFEGNGNSKLQFYGKEKKKGIRRYGTESPPFPLPPLAPLEPPEPPPPPTLILPAPQVDPQTG